jgi:predicted nucleotidyltransferase component of viral defense system
VHAQSLATQTREILLRFADTQIPRRFVLGGGTGLALHFGHRVSEDLDWFTPETFEALELHQELSPYFSCQVTGMHTNTLQLVADGVKVDFLRYAYPTLAEPVIWQGIPVFDIPDIAAMKLSAIANRGAKKDFHDLAELLDHHPLQQLLDWHGQKFPGISTMPVIRSLPWFDDAEADPDPTSLREITWDLVKKKVESAVRNL